MAGATTRLFGFSDAALARISTDGYIEQSIPEPETCPLVLAGLRAVAFGASRPASAVKRRPTTKKPPSGGRVV